MNLIENAITNIRNTLSEKFESCFGQTSADFTVEIPGDSSHGDFAANIAMVSAKALRQPPRKIAETLTLELTVPNIRKIEIAGAGFINFFLDESWYAEIIKEIDRQKDNYGRTTYGNGKRVLVEFVSANPTGPMHIGNARGGAIGDCLASVLDWAGYSVEREFYINDAGNQIEKFAVSLEARYLQIYKPDTPIPDDAYLGEDITNHAKNFAHINGDKFVEADSDERKNALVEYALPINIAALKDDLKKYRIEYDTWFKESSLHESGAAKEIIRLLTDGGYTYTKDDALWFKAEQFGADKDYVLVRANGIPTYVVPDIAYHYNKLVTRKFDKAIDVLGADHHGYVPRLKAAMTALGIPADKLDAVIMQMVRLVRNGEIAKLSKRSGKAITLVTLLDDIPIDAARFYFNLREPNSQFEFDLDLAIELSSKNPVFYVQYAHARSCNVLAFHKSDGYEAKYDNLQLLNAPQEIALIRHLALLPTEIITAANIYAPSKITHYCTETAALFHKFYDSCSIRNAETAELKTARLALCQATKTVLKNALQILKVDAPVKM